MRPWRALVSERAETMIPAVAVGCGFVLDVLADGSAAHGVALALRVLAGAVCGLSAVRGLGRFGGSALARRFSTWRAAGLLVAVLCVGLELLVRWPWLIQPTEGGLALDVVGAAWILLTGSVWDRASWERLVDRADREERSTPAPASVGWRGLGTSA